jgi:murein DD-endopeptidase MepM/ murein hydrolase activator NlpD
MIRFRRWLKKVHTPVTIMVIPHSRSNSRSIKMPFIAIVLVFVLSSLGVVYTVSLSVHVVEYCRMKQQYASMNKEFKEMASTMSALKESESQFRQLFSLGSKKEILNKYTPDEGGSIDLEELKKQISSSTESVKEIKVYLAEQRDRFLATPQGWPAEGRISSGFGMREHPKYGVRKFHTGADISLTQGTPLHATAAGIVSFADRSAGNGNIVVVEHGEGYSTVYAHNSQNLVHPGQKVKRGDVIAYSGSTGVSTGPHVHYEVWKNGKSVNPEPFLKGRFAN